MLQVSNMNNNNLFFYTLELKNYRQYYGTTRIEFSQEQDKLFTIIIGPNGSGKTNLMNAFLWCLYGKENYLKESSQVLPIINTKAIKEAKVGELIDLEVTITIGDENKIPLYKISRKLAVRKADEEYRDIVIYRAKDIEAPLPKNFLNPEPYVIESFLKYEHDKGWQQVDNYNDAVQMLLPSRLSNFFFFDGERLTNFFAKEERKFIKKGIEEISQITLLDNAIKHLEEIISDYRKDTKGYNINADNILNEISLLEERIERNKKILDDKRQELEKVESSLSQIEKELRTYSISYVRELQKKRDDINTELKRLRNQRQEYKNEYIRLLIELSPIVYLYDCIDHTLNILESNTEKGLLPPPISERFGRELIERGICICGRNINDERSKQSIEEYIKTAGQLSEIATLAINGKHILSNMKDSIDKKVDELDRCIKKIRECDNYINDKEQELREISAQLKKVDEERIRELESEREAKDKWRIELMTSIQLLEGDTYGYVERKKRLEQEHNKITKQINKLREINNKIRFCEEAKSKLLSIKESLIEETCRILEEKTTKYFLDLIWKKGTYQKCIIDKDYEISVIHKDGYTALGSLSAGETLYLALAFIAALRDITNIKLPLTIDTPLGRVSGVARINAASNLPQYLPDTQITLLVTDSEYLSPMVDESDNSIGFSFRDKIKHKVGKEYKLVFDSSKDTTRVEPFG